MANARNNSRRIVLPNGQVTIPNLIKPHTVKNIDNKDRQIGVAKLEK